MSRDTFVGIDPGLSGSVCVLGTENTDIGFYGTDQLDFLEYLDGESFNLSVGVETQTYSPRQRGAGTNMFNYGVLIGHLQAYGLKYEKIAPRTWYKFYRISSGLAYSERKKTTAAIMGELYPEHKHLLYGPRGGLLDGRSDALAIAHFLREQHASQ